MRNRKVMAKLFVILVFFTSFASFVSFVGVGNRVFASEIDLSKIQLVQAEAKIFARGQLPIIQNYAKTDIERNEDIKKGLNYQGTDVPERKYIDGNMTDAARGMQERQETQESQEEEDGSKGSEVKKMSKAGITSLIKLNQINRETHIEGIKESNLLDRARYAEKQPERYIDFLSGKYSDCKQIEGDEVKNRSIQLCDEYVDTAENRCAIGRIVEVDARHKYRCIKEKKRFKRISKSILNLTCNKWDEDFIKNINLHVLASSMGGSFNTLDSSNIEDSFKESIITGGSGWWSSDGCDRRWTRIGSFHIEDKELIKEFALITLIYASHIRVLVNGKQIFIGPHEGWTLNMDERRNLIDTGRVASSCAGSNQSWKGYVDLKPFLHDGDNNISWEVCSAGGRGGVGKIEIKVIQKPFCEEWAEIWAEKRAEEMEEKMIEDQVEL